MCGATPPLPQYVSIAWCLIKKKTSSFRGAWLSTGTSLPLLLKVTIYGKMRVHIKPPYDMLLIMKINGFHLLARSTGHIALATFFPRV
jgi:hypothetical protein